MHSDITAVTAQSNKIALNEARQWCATRAILQKKKKKEQTFWLTPYIQTSKKYSFSIS